MDNKEVKIDIGCGKNKQPGFTGVDIDPNSDADIIASALDLPFEASSVDEIHSAHLVEHFSPKEAEIFFDEINRVLKKGGKAHVKIDKDWSLARLLKKDPTHKYRYTKKELASMMSKFFKADVKNKIYSPKFPILRNKIFVEIEK